MRKPSVALTGLMSTGLVLGNAGAELPAKLTMIQARAIALKAAPGRVSKQAYDEGNEGWRFSFDGVSDNRLHKIDIASHIAATGENVVGKPRT